MTTTNRSTVRGLALRFALIFLAGGAFAQAPSASPDGLWHAVAGKAVAARSSIGTVNLIKAREFRLHTLDATAMRAALAQAPVEAMRRTTAAVPIILHLPAPDGSFQRFEVEESSIMEPKLQEMFPNIRTYVGRGLDDPAASARLDFTELGFHAQVLTPRGNWYIDPYYHLSQELYQVHARKDAIRSGAPFECLTHNEAKSAVLAHLTDGVSTDAGPTGATLRTYRLALACTSGYAGHFGGTVTKAFSAMTTAINRVTGIYEKELAIRLVFVSGTQSLVYTNPATDPYVRTDAISLLSENQTNIDNVIGSPNYDIGHVFSISGGGLADLGVVCDTGFKAMGETGLSVPEGDSFYVDYVAHEMGHQFGADHSFNSTLGFCSGNRVAGSAYEPGSGSTIMCYPGLCDSDDLQSNVDAYFHTRSYDQIQGYLAFSPGSTCGALTSTMNRPPVLTPPTSFTIPNNTPFALTAVASDPDNDTLTYCWEQFDKGIAAALGATDNGTGPLFRSFAPVASPTRYFPAQTAVANGTASLGEALPTYTGTATRNLNFRITARDNRAGGGGVAQALGLLTVATSAGPFTVTSQMASGLSFSGGSSVQVMWNVAGTNNPPISTNTVNVRLSTDGGFTFNTLLAQGVPNNGSTAVIIPSIPTSQGRLKVEPVGNVYYAINGQNFTITSTVASSPLINVATRLRVDVGDNVAIAGLVIQGTGSRRLLIRGVGPSLAGVTGTLADPTLELVSNGAQLAFNDNWKDTQQAAIQATPFAPTNDNESAMIQTLAPGVYTAILRGKNNTTGVGSIEIYDLETGKTDPRIVNLSTRGLVQTLDNVMIGGFVIGGGSAKKVLVRAIGPSLASAGVAGTLADPQISVVNASGVTQGSNNDWQATQAAQIQASGFAPTNAKEAAIILVLPPGAYTAIVSGVGTTTGVGLVEIYEIP